MIFHVYEGIPEINETATTYGDIQRAYNRMSNLYNCGELDFPAKIIIHKGIYPITRPLHFNNKFPVSIEAFEDERPIISGATQITDWQPCQINGVSAFRTVLPAEVKELPFFYVNGKMAQPARYPKKDLLRVTDIQSGDFSFSNGDNYDNFHYEEGDFNPSWYDPQNIMVMMTHFWIGEYLKIDSVDTAERKIVTASSLCFNAQKYNTEYYFSNIREELSEPGEYYFDRNTHELFYIPEKEGEDFLAEIPAVGTLVRFDSNAAWITLKGLTFQSGGNYMPRSCWGCDGLDLHDIGFADLPFKAERPGDPRIKPFYNSYQAGDHLPGVIFFHNASDCAMEDCEIRGCSWYGVQVYRACSRLTFKNNHLHHLGGGGFLINGVTHDVAQKDPSQQVCKIVIKGNHIHDCGQFYRECIGIISKNAWGCLFEDNHIHDLYYTGISCGWVWGYAPSSTREMRIHRNHIHDLGKKVLSDMGGIYLLGIQPGTRVWENTIHDISSRYYGGWGLYTDEGSSHIVLERNVVYNCNCNGYHQHYGRENIVRWNIFAFNDEAGWRVSHDLNFQGYEVPGEKHSKVISFINNVFITDSKRASILGNPDLLKNKKIYQDGNIYYDISGQMPECFATYYSPEEGKEIQLNMAEWQKAGLDRHSIFADPGFKDAANFDFTLKEDSILWDYGFNETVKVDE